MLKYPGSAPNKLYRALEILPGVLAWATLILMVVFSRYLPVAASIFIILFDTYWLFKSIYMSLHLRATFRIMKQVVKKDWLKELKGLDGWERIHHLVILPMYKESYAVVRETFEALARANYPLDKFIVVLALEERAGEAAIGVGRKIKEEFGNKFFKFLVTIHPDGIPGELAGKGANSAWAGREAKKLIDSLSSSEERGLASGGKIPYENILVSTFDIDTQIYRDYFSRLTYVYLTSPNRDRASYQPVPLFTNNIYEANAFSRVVSFSSTFWHMMNQARPERLTTFSSHSMPFKALVEIGFWTVDHVSEDSLIFWQCFMRYDSDWRVVPLYYPVSMDANVAPTFWQTMVNIYKQNRRWGWGVENVPYMLYGFINNPRIALRKKLYWGFNIIEGFHSWATNALMIFALGWLPGVLGGEIFTATILAHRLPEITRWIMWIAMFGIVTSATVSAALLPPKPEWFKKRHYLLYFAQWILMPVTLIIFGAIPGLESQTRLMFGGKFRLGFWVTPKDRYGNKLKT
jgi:cellulose synthase/poly-beta-1,6-N-acetylglucosamine synthase-like glycosyltransferase